MGRGFQMNTEYHIPIDEIISDFSKITSRPGAREKYPWVFESGGAAARFKLLLKRQRPHQGKASGKFSLAIEYIQ